VLHFSDNDSPGVLKVKLIRLSRKNSPQIFGDAVVLAKP
jgi:hypothetical protein